MKSPVDTAPRNELKKLKEHLVQWLSESAYPQWAAHGIDARNGGFVEALGQDGRALPAPRRARVQPRQIYAFAQAPRFGWHGDLHGILRRGIDYFTANFRRNDGLFRTLVDVNGAPLDDRALLYDQAFALLGYAAAATALDSLPEFERLALQLRAVIERQLFAGDGAFRSSADLDSIRESNPHMHLLEACLAWTAVGRDPGWKAWSQDLVKLALSRLLRPDSGALGEAFTEHWQPAAGLAGRIIEPGHQFEWAWLLMRSDAQSGDARTAALRLIEIGETMGVHNRVAVNELLDDFTIQDPNARLWPQTERFKAALQAACLTDDPRYWSMAAAAGSSLLPYLRTPVAGLWFDMQLPNGALVVSPAQASSFYHLVGAIAALDGTIETSSAAKQTNAEN